jgi:hypothetical protein
MKMQTIAHPKMKIMHHLAVIYLLQNDFLISFSHDSGESDGEYHRDKSLLGGSKRKTVLGARQLDGKRAKKSTQLGATVSETLFVGPNNIGVSF